MDKKRVIRGSDLIKRYEARISSVPANVVKEQRTAFRERVTPRVNAELERKSAALTRVSKLKLR